MTYPPTLEKCQKIFKHLKDLDTKNETEYNSEKYELIHDLAEAEFYEAKSYFIKGLDSDDPDYRWACLTALVTHWKEKTIILKLFEMAKNDGDTDVKYLAISSLGILKEKKALPLLKKILLGPENNYIKQSAYIAVSRILNLFPEREISELAISSDFDTKLITSKFIEALPDS
jgi:HEAT repeat protein